MEMLPTNSAIGFSCLKKCKNIRKFFSCLRERQKKTSPLRSVPHKHWEKRGEKKRKKKNKEKALSPMLSVPHKHWRKKKKNTYASPLSRKAQKEHFHCSASNERQMVDRNIIPTRASPPTQRPPSTHHGLWHRRRGRRRWGRRRRRRRPPLCIRGW